MNRVANAVAWAVLASLAVPAVLFVGRLGCLGLMLLGLLTCFVCSQMRLNDAMPTWSEGVFRAWMTSHPRPDAGLDGLRFYMRCGLVLIMAGGAGMLWQVLQ